jgi:hypothetical protein
MASTAIAIAEMMSGAAGRIAAIRTRGAETRAQMTMDASRTIADVMTKAADRAAQLFIERNRLALEYARLAAAKENSRGGGGGGGGRVREGTNQWDLMVAYARGEVDLEIAKGRTAAELAAKTMDIAAQSERLEAANATANRKIDVDAAIEQDKLDVEWERGNAVLVAAGKESRGSRKEYMAAQAAKEGGKRVELLGAGPTTASSSAAVAPLVEEGRSLFGPPKMGPRNEAMVEGSDTDKNVQARLDAIRNNAKTYDISYVGEGGKRVVRTVANNRYAPYQTPKDKAAREQLFSKFDSMVKGGKWRTAAEQMVELVDSDGYKEALGKRIGRIANEVARELGRGAVTSATLDLPVSVEEDGTVRKAPVRLGAKGVSPDGKTPSPEALARALDQADSVGAVFSASAARLFDSAKGAIGDAAVSAHAQLVAGLGPVIARQEGLAAAMSAFRVPVEGPVVVDDTTAATVAAANEARLQREAEEKAEKDRQQREAEEKAEKDRLQREAEEKARLQREAEEKDRLQREAEEKAREAAARMSENAGLPGAVADAVGGSTSANPVPEVSAPVASVGGSEQETNT